MVYIAFTGKACAGKTTVARLLTRYLSTTYLIRIADPLYEINNILGVDKNRKFMQDMGDLIRKYFGSDFLTKKAKETIEYIKAVDPKGSIIIDDIRMVNEARMVKDLGFKLIYLDTPDNIRKQRHEALGLDFNENHVTEKYVEKVKDLADLVIETDKLTIEELEQVLIDFVLLTKNNKVSAWYLKI